MFQPDSASLTNMSRISSELKYFDVGEQQYPAFTAYYASGPGPVTCINNVPIGSTGSTREGRQITIHQAHIEGYMYSYFNNPIVDALNARLMLVWDNQANGTLATVTDIMTNNTSISLPNLANEERFSILLDKTFTFGGSYGGGSPGDHIGNFPHTYRIRETVHLEGLTTYNASTDAPATGALLMLTFGNINNSDAARFAVTTRIRFQG